MRKVLFPLLVIAVCLALPALGGWAGYRLAYYRIRGEPWKDHALVRDLVERNHDNETLVGAFALSQLSLEGVEKCYYSPPDYARVTWVGKDMPSPFVGYAPMPGPLVGGHINSLQFRYRRELATPKPPKTCRIFLIGGSTAYGSGASSNETTVGGYLEQHLNEQAEAWGCRFEVITGACSGWASTNERILIENRLVELEPDVVVMLSGHNDVFWSLRGYNTQYFRGVQDTYYYVLLSALLLRNFAEELPPRLGGEHENPTLSQTCNRLRRNVELSHAALQAVGADYCFALQPIMACSQKVRTPREALIASNPGIRAAVGEEASYESGFAEFRAMLTDLQRPQYHFFDLSALFDDADGQTDIFLDRCHFGDRGYDLIARRLRDLLEPVLKARQQRAGKEKSR